MSCEKCGSSRIGEVGAKCSDLCFYEINGIEHDGYVPSGVGLGDDGDYVEIGYCLDCGQMEGTWPLPLSDIEQQEQNKDDDDGY